MHRGRPVASIRYLFFFSSCSSCSSSEFAHAVVLPVVVYSIPRTTVPPIPRQSDAPAAAACCGTTLRRQNSNRLDATYEDEDEDEDDEEEVELPFRWGDGGSGCGRKIRCTSSQPPAITCARADNVDDEEEEGDKVKDKGEDGDTLVLEMVWLSSCAMGTRISAQAGRAETPSRPS